MSNPQPPLPLHCFDPKTRKRCQYEQFEFYQYKFHEDIARCLWYKRKLEFDKNFDVKRCKKCLKEQNCVKWLTFSEAIPLLLRGKAIRLKGEDDWIYYDVCNQALMEYIGEQPYGTEGEPSLTKDKLTKRVWCEVSIVKGEPDDNTK